MKVTGFRVRITIQKNVMETDRYGNHKSVWADHFSCWSSAAEQTGDESEEASRTREKDRMDFTVRYCSETAEVTSKGYRILLDGRIYNITHVDDMGFRKRSRKFRAELEG